MTLLVQKGQLWFSHVKVPVSHRGAEQLCGGGPGVVLGLGSCCLQRFHGRCSYCSPWGDPLWKQQEELATRESGRAPKQSGQRAALWLEPVLICSSFPAPAGQKLLSTGL